MVQTVFWQQMKVDMGVSTTDLNHAQSANLAGLALGCLFFIPLTVKYGRRPSYLLSIAVLAGTTWWMSEMKTNAELMINAVLSGLAGAINETAVQMTVGPIEPFEENISLTISFTSRLPTCSSFTSEVPQTPFTSAPS